MNNPMLDERHLRASAWKNRLKSKKIIVICDEILGPKCNKGHDLQLMRVGKHENNRRRLMSGHTQHRCDICGNDSPYNNIYRCD